MDNLPEGAVAIPKQPPKKAPVNGAAAASPGREVVFQAAPRPDAAREVGPSWWRKPEAPYELLVNAAKRVNVARIHKNNVFRIAQMLALCDKMETPGMRDSQFTRRFLQHYLELTQSINGLGRQELVQAFGMQGQQQPGLGANLNVNVGGREPEVKKRGWFGRRKD